MPRFWTRLVDSLPRESKNLVWRVPLVIGVIALSACIFFPFRDTPYAVMTVKESYEKKGTHTRRDVPMPERREILDYEVTNRWVWLTSFFHYRVERELAADDLPAEGGRIVKKRRLEIRSRGLDLGLDLRGGSELLYRIQFDDETKRSVTAEEIKTVIQRRIDASGLREPRIQAQGADRLLVQLPGQEAADLQRVKSVIENTGRLEFRLVASEGSAPLEKFRASGKAPDGYTAYDLRSLKEGEEDYTKETTLISDRVEMTGDYISSTYVSTAGTGASLRPTVILTFTPVGEQKFGQITGENIDKQLAIILNSRRVGGKIVDKGICYSAPVIRTAIFSNAEISGDFDLHEARGLNTVLMAGSLPAPLKLEHENTVGPSLGPALISKGVRAITIGLGAVLIFMSAYYWFAGLVANFALFLNILIIVSVMILFDATLTLPGIAGLLLTVGMSVDANVLIFERIREERSGPTDKPLRLAIRDGYDRAFWTIFDAQLTTLFTGIILYWRGTGAIKGFAIVLCVGILASMFTALVVTRVIFNLLTWRRWLKNLPMLQLIRNPTIAFMSIRNKALVASVVLVVGGMTIFGLRGNDNWDIDFKGGQLIHAVFKRPMDADEIATRLREGGPQFAECELQPLAAAATEGAGPTFVRGRSAREFAIRFPYLSEVTIPKVTTEPVTSLASVEAPFTLHSPVKADDVVKGLKKQKARNYSITPTGQPDANGRHTTFAVVARIGVSARLESNESEAEKVRDKLSKAVAALQPKDKPLATFGPARVTINYRTHAQAEIDRAVPAADIQRELDKLDGRWKVEPTGQQQEGGRYTKFTIHSTVPSERDVRLAIEKAFSTQTLSAELKELFKDDLAPPGIEHLSTRDGRATVAVNLTRPVALATLEDRLANTWRLTDAKAAAENPIDAQATRFTIELPEDNVAELERRLIEDTDTFSLSDPIPRVAKVGPAVATQMLIWALLAIAAASVVIIGYVWLRFERFKYGVAAVAALLHDVMITVGLLAILGRSFNLATVAALLTIIGYSINDTIVVFDRIRENLRKGRKRDVDSEIIDASINQVLSRTVLTSATTLLAVLSLFLFAGGVIQDFALALLIGVFVGTYSSIFIASPLLILHQEQIEKRLR